MAVSLTIGIVRGVTSELLALLAWIAAFMAARLWGEPTGALLLTDAPDIWWRQLAGFVVVFLAVLIAFSLLRSLIALLLKAVGLRPLDRILGACFGLARGGLIVLALVFLGGMTPLPQQDWWRRALLAPPLETAVLVMAAWLPAELAQRIRYR